MIWRRFPDPGIGSIAETNAPPECRRTSSTVYSRGDGPSVRWSALDSQCTGTRPTRIRCGTDTPGNASGTSGSRADDESDPTPPDTRDERGGGSPERTRSVPVPAWTTGSSGIGRPADRQILVVGDTVAGLAVTGLLRRAGYDPVVVSGDGHPAASRVTVLWPTTLRLLEALAGGRSVPRGYAVDSVAVKRAETRGKSTVISDSGVTSGPVLARLGQLRAFLTEQLPESVTRQDRSLDALSRRDGALEVAFDDGVREWFDLVVDATAGDGSFRSTPGSERTASAQLTRYEMAVETDGRSRYRLRDVWAADGLLEVVSRPSQATAFVRLTTPRSDPVPVLRDLNSTEWVPESLPVESEREPTALRQAGQCDRDVPASWWESGRVVHCGRAGFPVAAATGGQVPLAIEDAWVLADELVHGPRSVSAVAESYADRRSRRLTGLLAGGGQPPSDLHYPAPDDVSAPLAAVGRLRAVALNAVDGFPATGEPGDAFGCI